MGVAESTTAGAGAGTAVSPGWGTVIGGGLGLVQGLFQANAAEKAAEEQAAAQRQALELNKQRYAETQGNLNPYITAGKTALGTYEGMLGGAQQPKYNYTQQAFDFNTYSDPGAQYRIAQANKAIQNSALARGMTGGGALTSLAEKNQEMAGQAYGDAFGRYKDMSAINSTLANNEYARNSDWLNNIMNRYSGLATGGQNAATQLGTIGTGNAAAMTGLYQGMGESQAQGTLGSSNAINQGIGQLAQGIGQWSGGNSGNGQVNTNFGGTK